MSAEYQLVVEGPIVDVTAKDFESLKMARIGIVDGVIKEIDSECTIRGDMEYHLKEMLNRPVITAGFTDVHTHARVPGHEHKEDFFSFGQAAIHGGVTTAFVMPNTTPSLRTPERLRENIALAKAAGISVFPYALIEPD